jgi:hypothetical protein
MRRGLRVGLLAAASCTLLGQGNSDRYQPLVRALGLISAQFDQLSDAQQRRLADTAKVLQQWDTAGGAVAMGLMDASDWPGEWPCFVPNSRIASYAKEYDLTSDQVDRLKQLQDEVRQRAVNGLMEIAGRVWKLSTSGANSPSETAALNEETARLVKQRDEARPPRDLALAILNDVQKAKVAALRADVELAREALELHLIRLPGLPEILCH